MKGRRVLFVDDDHALREVLKRELEDFGLDVSAFGEPLAALEHVARTPVDVALIDLRLPGLDGLELLQRLRAIDEALPVVMLTGHGAVREAVEAMRRGAHDFLTKPVSLEALERILTRAIAQRDLLQENRRLRRLTDTDEGEARILGDSEPIRALRELIERVAPSAASVLVLGESGTGKELVARAIHARSPRAARPFVVVHCGAIPENLVESELFGHERGAFTGAFATRRGLLETSAGGTCFLDEIAELTPPLQAKLLRALQERAVRRVGGNEAIPVDVRILAATNRDLHALVPTGEFRDDLYYRLNVVTIAVPPLRERGTDIPLLAQHFLEKFAAETGRSVKHLAPETLALLASYQWPGNVRELEHAIERAVALASSEALLPEDLPPHVRQEPAPAPRLPGTGMTLDEVKRWYIHKVLDETGGNKVRAAELLGINRRTLYRILERQATGDDDDDE